MKMTLILAGALLCGGVTWADDDDYEADCIADAYAWMEEKVDIPVLKEKAAKGDSDAQYKLGCAYLHGMYGVEKDAVTGVYWLEKADAAMHRDATRELGWHYWLSHDTEKAYAKLKNAALVGDTRDCVQFADFCWQEMRWGEAAEWYQEGVSKKTDSDIDAAAAYVGLGNCYLEGKGVPKDLEQAKFCFRSALDKKDAHGAIGIGKCYMQDGKNEDAYSWFEEAFKMDWKDSDANFMMGYCLEFGVGRPANPREAFSWYKKCEDHADAEYRMGLYYENGTDPCTKDARKAFELFKSAAELGSADGMFKAGECCEKGLGTPKDSVKAMEYYLEAAKRGHEGAKARIDR